MKRLYELIPAEQFERVKKGDKYRKLLFALAFFHSVIIERKKFLQLGWNVHYTFNDSDFQISENLLAIYLDSYEKTPFDALKYLIAIVIYGGHCSDEWDMRLLHVRLASGLRLIFCISLSVRLILIRIFVMKHWTLCITSCHHYRIITYLGMVH